MLRTTLTRLLALASLLVGVTVGGPAMATNAHDFSFDAIDGGPLPMSKFKGKAVLVVNTASFCGFTPQYDGLEALWKDYEDEGLVVLGVPANNFGGQEPGSNDDIKQFCEANYSVDFPLTAKVSVTGADAHPFYKWAEESLGTDNVPKWNFHKYLVDARGNLVAAFPSAVRPQSKELTGAVDKALAK
jgi:glutathione peroxidase